MLRSPVCRALASSLLKQSAVKISLRNIHFSRIQNSKLTDHKYDEAELMSSRLTKQEYFAKRANVDIGSEEKPSSEAELALYKRLEAVQGLISGALGIIALIIAITVYQKWPNIKSWWLKVDEEELIPIRPKKKKFELPVIKNLNDSSVPGLYICGDNSNYITSQDKSVKEQKSPIRFDWFDHKTLKFVELGETSALAIDSKGDLIQWGRGFNNDSTPVITLKGEGLTLAKFSNGAIYALNKKNEILVIPESSKDQAELPGLSKRRWHYLTKETKPYTKLSNELFAKNEKIVDLKTGQNHLVILTDSGKTYTSSTGLFSTSQASIKSVGQFGLPEFSQFAKTSPPINTLFEIVLLNNEITKTAKGKIDHIEPRVIKQIATGNFHTLALDVNGEVFSFGLNTYGQLGHPVSYDTEIIPFPKKITLFASHVKRDFFADVKEIHAGGDTSFCKIVPVQLYKLIRRGQTMKEEDIVDDSFVVGFGNNLKGQIGNGHYVHAQFDPIKIKELSKFEDYNEVTNQLEKVEVVDWQTGSEHSFIRLANSDVLYWGANDYGQLGNGKKNRIPKPENPPVLIEPGFTKKTYKDLTFVNRLQLKDNQKIVAGERASAIYYTS